MAHGEPARIHCGERSGDGSHVLADLRGDVIIVSSETHHDSSLTTDNLKVGSLDDHQLQCCRARRGKHAVGSYAGGQRADGHGHSI